MKYIFIYQIINFFLKNIFSDKINGVNIGGWLVLEPWITPSLFYQFLGKTDNNIAMDMYSFCDVLGPKEANKQLRNHWSSWIEENHIKKLSDNNINTLRIPVGDWMYIPYGPYLKQENGITCTNGSIEELDRVFNIANKYNIKIIIDLHGVKGSQNGFDNSGQTKLVEIHNNRFKHWEIRSANWIGEFDLYTKEYISFDDLSIEHSKNVLKNIIKKYSIYDNLKGLTVLNEPWEYTPEIFLKKFYIEIFDIFQTYMSFDKLFIIHDSFRSQIWEDFYIDNNNKNITILIDTHQYTAWNDKYISFDILLDSSKKWQSPRANYKYIIGEWSLAIDNCQMWLNGFMDNVPNYPLYTCTYQMCPKYREFKKNLDNSIYGPFGTGVSYPNNYYQCPTSIPLNGHFLLNDNIFPEKDLAKKLFEAKSNAFEKESFGWIFWNFRTESESYQWDYLAYINLINSNTNKDVNYLIYKYTIITIIIVSILSIICLIYCLIIYNIRKNKKYEYVSVKQFEITDYKNKYKDSILNEKSFINKKVPLYTIDKTINI